MIRNVLQHYDYLILGGIILFYIFQVERRSYKSLEKQFFTLIKICFYSSMALYILQTLSIVLNNIFQTKQLTSITFWINLMVAITAAIIDLILFVVNSRKQKGNSPQAINFRLTDPDWKFLKNLSDDQKKSIFQCNDSQNQNLVVAKKIYRENRTKIFYNFKFCKIDAHGFAIYQSQQTLLTKSRIFLAIALITLFCAICFVEKAMEIFFLLVGISLFSVTLSGIFIFRAAQKPVEYFIYAVFSLYKEPS